ncbi:MAG TPA: hypothetical protein VL181_10380, partial [Holophagaceae bacterium]|nr:hypothetical protein [Holophagaceae bacterium]
GWDWVFDGGPTSWDKESDGINHDNDVITLLLNPHVVITQSTQTNIATSYGYDSSDTNVAVGDMDLTYLTVGQIKAYLADPAWTPTGPLARAWAGTGGGISKAELQQMLQADPYSNDPTGANTSVNGLVASGRYTPVGGQNIVYTPTVGGATVQKYTASYETITAIETTDKLELKAEMKVTGGAGISNDFEVKGVTGFLFVWSHQNLDALSTDTKQQTTVNIQSPAADYTGPQSIVMYQDNLFGSIMFAPAPIH